MNPAVTLGLAATGKFPWRYVPAYLIAQLVGAVLGALATWATFGTPGRDCGSCTSPRTRSAAPSVLGGRTRS